jgi:hypothetical protein
MFGEDYKLRSSPFRNFYPFFCYFSSLQSKYFITLLFNTMNVLSFGHGENEYVYAFMIKCVCEISLCQQNLLNILRLHTTVRPRSIC